MPVLCSSIDLRVIILERSRAFFLLFDISIAVNSSTLIMCVWDFEISTVEVPARENSGTVKHFFPEWQNLARGRAILSQRLLQVMLQLSAEGVPSHSADRR